MGRFYDALITSESSNEDFMAVARTVKKKEEVIDFYRNAIKAAQDLVVTKGSGNYPIMPEEQAILYMRRPLLSEMDTLEPEEQERIAKLFDFENIEGEDSVLVLIPLDDCPGCPNCRPKSSELN